MLSLNLKKGIVEVGVDEAGRGCLAGDVYAAAVILPDTFKNELLNDSKQLTAKQRDQLREIIERESLAWGVGVVTAAEIDDINILNASILAMHRALEKVEQKIKFKHIIVDGNRFKPYKDIAYTTVIKGDATYMSIAAASILAKTHRDEYMCHLADKYPEYDWKNNKGYPTKKHREAIKKYGPTPYHRMTFRLLDTQPTLEFDKI